MGRPGADFPLAGVAARAGDSGQLATGVGACGHDPVTPDGCAARDTESANGARPDTAADAGTTPTNGGSEPSHRSPGNKYDSSNALLAYHVQHSIMKSLDHVDRGLRRAGFLVLREVSMPGILIEGGFMTNPGEASTIYDAKHRRQMAQAIADGVLAYKRLAERK